MPNQIWGAEADASPCSALLVAANGSPTNRVREFLAASEEGLAVEHAEDLAAARQLLGAHVFDVVLFDRPSFARACAAWPDPARRAELFPPIIVLAERDDPDAALESLREGAQDYLDIHSESPRRIARCIRHAIERYRLVTELREARERAQFAATHDPLTQLPNRHLFEEQIRRVPPQAERTGASAALLRNGLAPRKRAQRQT